MNSSGPSKLRFGLHTRLSLGVAAVVLTATFTIATCALHFVKTSLRASIAGEQLARVSAVADAIDQKLSSRRILLQTFGDSVVAQDFKDAELLQGFLEKHAALKQAFDNVAFIDMEGNLVANQSGAVPLGSVNIKDRSYFRQTVASKTGIISQPYRNRLNGLAQVAITEPVLDSAGQVRYVISGAINLKDRNILGALAEVKIGKTGYLFITTTDGIVIDHPRTSRILNHVQADGGASPQVLRAIAGFEGTSEGVDEGGDELERARRDFVRWRQSIGGRGGQFSFTRHRSRRGMADVVSGYLSSIDEGLPAIIERLRTIQVLCRPALAVIRGWDGPETLFYCDPPYLLETRAAGCRNVYGVEMTDQDHRELAAALRQCRGKVALSGYPSHLYDELYDGWRTVSFDMANHAAGALAKPREVERLWLNWPG